MYNDLIRLASLLVNAVLLFCPAGKKNIRIKLSKKKTKVNSLTFAFGQHHQSEKYEYFKWFV
jgi:hypothetical protein